MNRSEQYVKGWSALEINLPLGMQILTKYGKAFNRPKTAVRYLPGGEPQQCYANSFKLAVEAGMTYVEGYAVPKSVPIPLAHAWVLDAHGRIVDNTWKDGTEYFGVAFKTEDLIVMSEMSGYAGGVFENLYLIGKGLSLEQAREWLVQSIATGVAE